MSLLDIPKLSNEETEYVLPEQGSKSIKQVLDNVVDKEQSLSTEYGKYGIDYVNKVKEAYEKEATMNSATNFIGKKDNSVLLKELEEEAQKEQEEKERKSENRKQAMDDLSKGIKDTAKAAGSGLKEGFRIAYNLITGSDVKKKEDKDED